MSESNLISKKHSVIKCESVYKIFGNNANKMLADSNGKVDEKTLSKVGINELLRGI